MNQKLEQAKKFIIFPESTKLYYKKDTAYLITRGRPNNL